MLLRRELLSTAIAASAGTWLSTESTLAAQATSKTTAPCEITDTNVNLFHWPFRRLPLDETEVLVAKLRSLGISQAWAGSFEGLLHRDITSVNSRLAVACKPYRELRPVGSINLELPGWQTDLARCREDHDMHAIRLHPNYHGYTLEDPRFLQLLEQTSAAGMLVQIAVCMEDPRTQHSRLQVADVDWDPLPPLLHRFPQARVQLLNARLRNHQLAKLAQAPRLFSDTARSEGIDGVASLLHGLPAGRVMFGSHSPFLILESALIRVGEAELTESEIEQVMASNARAC